MRKWIGIAIALALVAGIISLGCKREPREIKIGAVMPLTGDAAVYGQSIKKGIDLALLEVNERGGIKGRKASVTYEDSRALPADGVAAFRKLINVQKVSAVLGGVVSSVTLAIAPIAEQNEILILSPLSSAPAITEAGDYVFRNVPSDLYNGKVAAHFAVRYEGWNRLAILFVNNDFGVGLSDVFTVEAEHLKAKVVRREAYEQGSTDFRAQLTKIKSATPDAIFLVAYKEAPQILIQAKELGVKSKFIGTGLLEDPNTIKLGKEAVEGLYFTQLQYDPESPDTLISDYVKRFTDKYGASPDIISAYGYDAMMVLASAMNSAGLTAKSIKEHLYRVKDFHGVTGNISFDENGDVIQPMGVKVVENGEFIWFKREISIE